MIKFPALLNLIFSSILKTLMGLFGVFHWQPPKWLNTVNNWLHAAVDAICKKPLISMLTLLAILITGSSSWFAYHWWQSRPQPVTIDFSIQAPERANLEKNAPPNPLVVTFDGSVAPLALVDKDVTQGISISPVVAGRWHWQDDKTLEFRPDKEWAIGQQYKVTLEKSIVASQIKLARRDFTFDAPAFTSTLVKTEFYQDPLDPVLKKAIIQLRFSHPVNSVSLEKNIKLEIKNDYDRAVDCPKLPAEFVSSVVDCPAPSDDQKTALLPFTVTYDKLKLNAFVHSKSLPVPRYNQRVFFTLTGDVNPENSKAVNGTDLKASVTIPGLYIGLAVSDVQFTITPNKLTQQQDQILVLSTSLPVHEQQMAKAVHVWLLPEYNPNLPEQERNSKYYWSPERVTADLLELSTPVSLQALPAEHEFTQQHSFLLHVEVGRQLFVKIDKDIKSFGGYQLPKEVYRVLPVPDFPKELHILGEGSLLTLSGEKKLGLMMRDLLGVKVELGRVLPEQLQNLITQSNGDFSHPNFSGNFGQDNLSERFELALPLSEPMPGKPRIQSVDLSQYLLDEQGKDKHGIFLVTAKNYDPANPQASYAEVADNRLIMVTDLGIIVKTEQSGSQVVFVQSIQTGQPQAQASVDIIGKNGLVLFHGDTDEDGKVRFANLSILKREREPVFYLVKHNGDMSFLPMKREDRKLDFSRFNIGGAENPKDANQLNAYLFSDRGIYRPGDTFHIGIIVKTELWNLPLEGLPLQVEVLDSRGLVIKRNTINLSAGGFNELSHETLENSPTGNYTVNLYTVKDNKPDQLLGNTTVKVEEFQPDRIKTTAKFSKPVSGGWVHPKDLQVTVNVQNLYGAPAEAREVEATISLQPALPAFKQYKDYNFFDPHYAKDDFNETLTALQTNIDGNAAFELHLEKYAAATYKLHFAARAFEAKGGRSVGTEADTLVSDMPFLVGYKADGALDFVAQKALRHARLLAIDPELKPYATQNLSLEFIERKMLSVLTHQTDNTYKYESRLKEIGLKKEPLTLDINGFNLLLDSSTAGDYSYLIRNADGLILTRIDYSVAGTGNVSRSLDRNAELQLTLDKTEYAPGEKIAINIRAPYTGAGLITIEREKVYTSVWFKADTESTVQTIEVPKDMLGNAYVSVQYIRDTNSDEIFMSPLSYGVAPFKISLAAHTQDLKLSVPELIKPGQILSMKLKSPEPTRVVVFAVDEGILQVAQYQNPDPLGHFFKKRQLQVDTKQILDLILPEFKKFMQIAVPGGDSNENEASFLNPFKRKHDKPAVYWSGIVDLNGEQAFSYQVPDTFNGTLRILAVAVNNERIASISDKTLVRGDLIISPNAPFVVAPDDEFTVSVAIANNIKDSGSNAPVQVALSVPSQLVVKGEAKKSLTISEGHESVVTFQLQALSGNAVELGNATLAFNVESHGQTATMHTDLSIRPAMPKLSGLHFGSFNGQKDISIERQLYAQRRKVSAGLSPLPLISVPGLTSYLENFEHYCTEQLISKAMSMLVLTKHPEFTEEGRVNSPEANFLKLMSVLRTRQNAEGGFGLWVATPEAHEFASVYAVHLLTEALAEGFAMPDDMLQKSLTYLNDFAASPNSDLAGLRMRAYAAYLLTRQGTVTSTLLSSLREALRSNFSEQVWRNDLATVYLAASYQLLKQESVANDLINTAAQQLGQVNDNYDFEDYYDPLIHDAQTLYILAKHFPKRLQAMPTKLFLGIAKSLQDRHYNTLSSAYLLLAYNDYLNAVPMEVTGQLAISAFDQAGREQALSLPAHLVPRVDFPDGTVKLRFSGPSSLPLYYAVSESGYDKLMPTAELRDGLEIMRSYINAKGETVDHAALGEELIVKLRMRAIDRDWVNNVVLQDLLPGGFEAVIQNPVAPARSDDEESNDDEQADNSSAWKDRLSTGGNWVPEYADIREDRVVLYGTFTNELAEYQYKVKATAAGTFQVPPVYAQSMYELSIQARSGAGKMRVDDLGNKQDKHK